MQMVKVQRIFFPIRCRPIAYYGLVLFVFLMFSNSARSQDKDLLRIVQAIDTLNFIDENKLSGGLQQIVLIRHGEPAVSRTGRFDRNEARRFIQTYDSVGIITPEAVPFALDTEAIDTVYTSRIPRAMHTASILFPKDKVIVSRKLFNEFQRKIIPFPNVDMSLRFWTTSARALWLIGLNDKGIESRKQAMKRTSRAADFLEERAKRRQRVVLVAHGFLNRQLTKEFKSRGWQLLYQGDGSYLSPVLLVKRSKT